MAINSFHQKLLNFLTYWFTIFLSCFHGLIISVWTESVISIFAINIFILMQYSLLICRNSPEIRKLPENNLSRNPPHPPFAKVENNLICFEFPPFDKGELGRRFSFWGWVLFFYLTFHFRNSLTIKSPSDIKRGVPIILKKGGGLKLFHAHSLVYWH